MTVPIFLSPALPSELLSYILDCHVYPTTLIVCSSRAEFLNSLVEDILRSQTRTHQQNETQDREHDEPSTSSPPPPPQGEGGRLHGDPGGVTHALLSSPLYQVATSRHIRVIYVSTVTHLRACLSVFTPDDSRVAPPPPNFTTTRNDNNKNSHIKAPHIVLYGFLALHRDTSEWSAQGLSNTASAAVDLAHRLSWQALVIEPRIPPSASSSLGQDGGAVLLGEPVPILSGGARRLGPHSEEGGAWTGRTVEIGRILGRWFRFERARWDPC
jgi:hypothetical protein